VIRAALVLALVLGACASDPPPPSEPFDVMTALAEANRKPPAPQDSLRPGACHRITEKECW
jgi:hypothetical protein